MQAPDKARQLVKPHLLPFFIPGSGMKRPSRLSQTPRFPSREPFFMPGEGPDPSLSPGFNLCAQHSNGQKERKAYE